MFSLSDRCDGDGGSGEDGDDILEAHEVAAYAGGEIGGRGSKPSRPVRRRTAEARSDAKRLRPRTTGRWLGLAELVMGRSLPIYGMGETRHDLDA